MSIDDETVAGAQVSSGPVSGTEDRSLLGALGKTQEHRTKIHNELPKVSKDKMDDWWEALIREATSEDFIFEGTALRSVERRIAEIDEQISKQLAEVMHHEDFQKLEGSWSGLKRFVTNTEIKKGELEIYVMNCSKEELTDDFEKAGKPHLSSLYQKTMQDSYNVFGGVPFGIIVGDYAWTGHPRDIDTLTSFAKVASASHTSIITSPAPELFQRDSWQGIAGLNTNAFADILQSPECIEWRNFRQQDESRYVTMAMPRTLARLPYGHGNSNIPVKEFRYEELPLGEMGENIEALHESFCWSSAAYGLAERITESFFVWGWTTSIRGVENGGIVRNLPLYKYIASNGDTKVKCPSEVVLNHEQEFALSNQGFCPLEYYLERNYSVFAGGQTAHKPREVAEESAQESENLSARLPYILASSRVSHFLKAIAHDKVGSFLQKSDAEVWLNNWLKQYTDASENPSENDKRRKPFKKAVVVVTDKPGDPGFYQVRLLLAPWIQFEGMTADITLVGDIEKAQSQKK